MSGAALCGAIVGFLVGVYLLAPVIKALTKGDDE